MPMLTANANPLRFPPDAAPEQQVARLLGWVGLGLAVALLGGCVEVQQDFSVYEEKGWLVMHLATFAAGLVVSFTGCVYPMIPIVVGVFGGRDEEVSRAKALLLATMYVLGMGLLFSSLGLGFALVGRTTGFGSILGNLWVVIPLVSFYVLLAASMFGAFELRLPWSLQDRLSRVGGRGYGGAFALGMVGALTAAPCTGPLLLGVLTFVATEGNVVGGFSLLFTHALGIGVLFWVVAVFAVSLPKSGPWMDSFKSVGGIALLGVASYFLQNLKPVRYAVEDLVGSGLPYLSGALMVGVVGIALGAVHLSFHGPWADKLRKGLGILVTVASITAVVGWSLKPERNLAWVHDEATAFATAQSENKGVMIDFSADWCTPCKQLEKMFGTREVFDYLMTHYVPLKFDVSDQDEDDLILQKKYGAGNLPAVRFVDAAGNPLGGIDQAMGAEQFLEIIRPITERLLAREPGRTARRSLSRQVN